MSIELLVRPPFREEWTRVSIDGEHQDEVLNILASRLDVADYEVQIEDADSEMIPFEEYEA